MRSIRFSTVAFVTLLLAGAATLPAQPARDRLVVSTDWLAKHLSDPNLVLLHVGEKSEYDARHIPGARYVPLSDISVSDRSGQGLMLEMLPAGTLRDRLAALGISDTSRVVVYYGKDWVSPTTRVIFTLEYAGLGEHTSILDGGLEAWVREGREVTDALPAVKIGTLSPLQVRPLIVDAEFVRANLASPDVAIVDARTPAFYGGTQAGGRKEQPHRAGHIPKARSIPFSTLTNEDLTLRSTDELAAAFKAAGVEPGDTVITYCHIGQQATATLFAARLLGYKTLLYDGSFEDWSRRTDFPVETSSDKKP
jgi:thiosulfate/3-mercaptopyruvate sulfurtransferase